MDSAHLLDLSTEAVWVMIKISMPALLAALVVGLLISLLQALTQIQEPTLSFVPKILAVFATILMTLGFVGNVMGNYAQELMTEITNLE